jgi:hypothetical protein
MIVGALRLPVVMRHDRGIDHTQALHAMHATFAIHHGHLVGAHLARAGRVERGFGVLADELVQLLVGLHVDARADFAATVRPAPAVA